MLRMLSDKKTRRWRVFLFGAAFYGRSPVALLSRSAILSRASFVAREVASASTAEPPSQAPPAFPSEDFEPPVDELWTIAPLLFLTSAANPTSTFAVQVPDQNPIAQLIRGVNSESRKDSCPAYPPAFNASIVNEDCGSTTDSKTASTVRRIDVSNAWPAEIG